MDYQQKDRRFSITAPNGSDDLLLLHNMTLEESISGLFRIQLDLFSESDDIAFEDIIGKPLSIRANHHSGGDVVKRFFHGIVARFSQGPPVDSFISYQAEVVPWLWLLTRASDCRIFQQMTLPDIVKAVFDDLHMADYKFALAHSYPKREYCVQYRETHFNFVSRILEEAGIGYYFQHTDTAHTLVLFDDPSGNEAASFDKEASYASAVEAGRPSGEIEDWHVRQEMPSGKYATADFNFEDPGMDLTADVASSISLGGNDRFEVYDYPGEYSDLAEGKNKITLRMEAEEAASYSIEGRSARGDFSAGYAFDLVGHYRSDFDKTYLITSATHHMSQGYGGESDQGADYSNTFECIPHSVPYVPIQRTPKPLISGAQTARVVGASGEEIDVDEYGRIVVQFHWDRQGKKDEKSSCRVRVAQSWAGKNWGAVFNPRIGQEVIVEFLEGDPDRPLVTGRLYNGEQTVPYEVPSNKTQSGIKSRSSKDGGSDNFNEIRFEDKLGSEVLAMQAEKDLERLIKNNEADSVGNDRTRSVGNDETISVGHDRKAEVGNNDTETIGANQTLTVGADRTRDVGSAETITVAKDQTISIGKSRSLNVGETQEITVGKNQTVTVGKNYETSVGSEYSLEAKKIRIVASDELTIKVGKAEFVLKKSGDVSLKGKKINLKGSGDVIIKGSKVTQN